MGIGLMYPENRMVKQVVVHEMIFMGMRCDENINLPLLVKRKEFFPVTGSIDDYTSFIIDDQTVAVRVSTPQDNADRSLAKVIHNSCVPPVSRHCL